jgi:DNA-binding ferritin-like protein
MYKKRKQKQNLRQTSAAGLSGQQAFVLIFLHSTTKAFEYNISGANFTRGNYKITGSK